MTMQISADGIAAIYRRECRPPKFEPELTAYLDSDSKSPTGVPAGNWTIGCGHAGPEVREGMTITREQADALFKTDIRPCEAAVNANISVPLSQNQFDALCSFAFNVGLGGFQTSTLVKVLNAGKYEKVPDELRKWNKSGGKVNDGLINRRNSEIGQWARGAFVSSASVPVDPPPSWWQQAHNRLIATGITTIVGDLAGDNLKRAGQDLQSLAPSWHGFAAVGCALIVLGVIWNIRKQ